MFLWVFSVPLLYRFACKEPVHGFADDTSIHIITIGTGASCELNDAGVACDHRCHNRGGACPYFSFLWVRWSPTKRFQSVVGVLHKNSYGWAVVYFVEKDTRAVDSILFKNYNCCWNNSVFTEVHLPILPERHNTHTHTHRPYNNHYKT